MRWGKVNTTKRDLVETAHSRKLFYIGRCSRLMLPESVLNTLAGGVIGIASGLAIWIVRDWIEVRRRRRLLIDAIDSAARSCTAGLLSSSYVGRGNLFNPATQFLATFWRDLPLLGTQTQMEVVSFFSDVIDVARSDSPPSQGVLDGIERLRQVVMRLLALERRGKRQNVKPDRERRAVVDVVRQGKNERRPRVNGGQVTRETR